MLNDLESHGNIIYQIDVTALNFVNITKPLAYFACHKCKKKLDYDKETSTFFCKVEQTQTNFPQPIYSFNRWVQDSTGSLCVKFFEKSANLIMGDLTADEYINVF